MSVGWQRTYQALERSANRAAHSLLAEMVFAAPPPWNERALELVLLQKDRRALYTLVSRFDQLAPAFKARLTQLGEDLGYPIREAYLNDDQQIYQNACELIVLLPAYDQISLVLGSVHHDSPRKRDAEHLVRKLGEKLAGELDGDEANRSRADIDRVRAQFLSSLEHAMARFAHHKMAIIPEAVLLLAQEDSPLVRKVLSEPGHTCHGPMIDALRTRQDARIARWLIGALHWRQPPTSVLQTIAQRRDPWFRSLLLSQLKDFASPAVAHSLRQIREFLWMSPRVLSLRSLDENEQRALVILTTLSGMSLDQKLELLGRVLDEGKPAARQAAACALLPLSGTGASELVAACVHDRDPLVQLAGLQQARMKHLPNVLQLFLARVDHPDARLREVARTSLLEEYNFDRYARTFEQMDDRSRVAVGQLVQKIDPDFLQKWKEHFFTDHRSHRIRAAKIAATLKLGDAHRAELLRFLNDPDHIVRHAVVEALAVSATKSLFHDLSLVEGDVLSAGTRELLETIRQTHSDPWMRSEAEKVIHSGAVATGS